MSEHRNPTLYLGGESSLQSACGTRSALGWARDRVCWTSRFPTRMGVWRWTIGIAAMAIALVVPQYGNSVCSQDRAEKDRVNNDFPIDTKVRVAISLPVEFPLDSSRETKLLSALESLAARSSGVDRPLVVLEFKSAQVASNVAQEQKIVGRGTSFERALSIARWLSGPKGTRLQSVAYLPESIGSHAVLVALACEEIAMAPEAEMGQATLDETSVDPTIRQAYLDIAARRGAFPPPAILSMLDPNESLVRIDFESGEVEYTTLPELSKREQKNDEWTELVPPNQLARFLGHELRQWRWIAHTAGDREQLSNALKLNKPIVDQPMFEGSRVAIRTHIRGIVTNRHIDRTIRALEEGLAQKETNLVLIEIDSSGGNVQESLRLAQYIADIAPEKAETVAYISGNALGDAALIALACDSVMMSPDAKLGGPGEASISPAQCLDNKGAIENLARSSGRGIGELLGCVCPTIPIFEYSSFDGRTQLQSPDWLIDDPINPQWNKGAAISFKDGLRFDDAAKLKLAVDNPVSLEAVGSKFGLESLPREKETNRAEQIVDWLSRQVWLSYLLFVIGITALSSELSAPGLGPGAIIAAVCFGLFFWLRFLDGTVEWLEVLLIVGGVICLGVEFLVLPGFGVFGVSGLAMLGIGLLLASQTFIIPTNDYQRQKVVQGFGQIGLLTLVLIGLAFAFRKQLANSPMVRWLSLQPPEVDREKIEMEKSLEELQMYIGWNGTTLTRCNPGGRAAIGDKMLNVHSEEGWIDEDSEITVVGIHENSLTVRKRTSV